MGDDDDSQHGRELREDETLERTILRPQLTQLLDPALDHQRLLSKLDSPTHNASILVDVFILDGSILDKNPCLPVVSCCIASCSRSIEICNRQTGHSGASSNDESRYCTMHARQKT